MKQKLTLRKNNNKQMKQNNSKQSKTSVARFWKLIYDRNVKKTQEGWHSRTCQELFVQVAESHHHRGFWCFWLFWTQMENGKFQKQREGAHSWPRQGPFPEATKSHLPLRFLIFSRRKYQKTQEGVIFSTHQEPIPRGDQIPVTIENFDFFNIFGIFSDFFSFF